MALLAEGLAGAEVGVVAAGVLEAEEVAVLEEVLVDKFNIC